MSVGVAVGALVLALTPINGVSAGTGEVCADAPDAGFSDVVIGDIHTASIDCMTAYGVGQGRDDGSYGVYERLTRGQASTLFVQFVTVATDGAVADLVDGTIIVPFTDIAGSTHEAEIRALYQLGLVQGTSPTTFSPEDPITRGQYASILKAAHDLLLATFRADPVVPFVDIDSSVHRAAITVLADAGIIRGLTADTFGPGLYIYRGQTVSLLAASAGLLDDQGQWVADRLGVLPELVPSTGGGGGGASDGGGGGGDTPPAPTELFTVTASATTVTVGDGVTVTADVGDATEVTVWLLDAADVDDTGEVVTFTSSPEGLFAANPAASGTVLTTIDNVTFETSGLQTTRVGVPGDGTFELGIDTGEVDGFVVLVAETLDGALPVLDDGGTPVERFGVTAQILVASTGGDVVGTSTATDGGQQHTVVLDGAGDVWTFGGNFYGQLGNSVGRENSTGFPTPAKVVALDDPEIVAIAAGVFHTVALDAAGDVWTFGHNQYGQLGRTDGNTTTTGQWEPMMVAGLDAPTIVAVAAGRFHTVALDDTGEVWAFGHNNRGQLGTNTGSGTDAPQPVPTKVLGLDTPVVTAIAAGGGLGGGHTVALDEAGDVWTFGGNFYGQLGNATGIYDGDDFATGEGAYPTPTKVAELDGATVTAIAAGGEHTIVLDQEGDVWSFGANQNGQLGNATGNGTNNPSPTPGKVAGLDGPVITAVSAGGFHTAVLDDAGDLWTFGESAYGQLSWAGVNSGSYPTPTKVTGLDDQVLTAIATGYRHTIARQDNQDVWTFGRNDRGQLGNNEVADADATPRRVLGIGS